MKKKKKLNEHMAKQNSAFVGVNELSYDCLLINYLILTLSYLI